MSPIPKTFHNQRGQTLLIVVLVMVIALTVGLSLASRNITDLKISTEQANSQQALSAAEAGIESLLGGQSGQINNTKLNNTTNAVILHASSAFDKGPQIPLNGGHQVSKDDGFDVWLVNHLSDDSLDMTSQYTGTLTFYWGKSGETCATDSTNTMPALEIVVISGASISNLTTTRYVYDPCAARLLQNSFTQPATPGAGEQVRGVTYAHKVSAPISVSNAWVARLVPLYAPTVAGVIASPDLPSQGKSITSVGQSGNAERQINAFQSYPQLPSEFFPHILFCTVSGSGSCL